MSSAHRLAVALALAAAPAPPLAAQPRPQPVDTVRVAVPSRAGDATALRTVEVLGRTELDRLPARTLGDVLARALGVAVPTRSPASADLTIRGSSFEQVLVLVDGVRVSDAQTGHFDLDLAVPLASVERVEVLRGGGSALYGADAVGGVVNVVTRRAADGATAANGSVQAGSFGTAALTGAARGAARGVRWSAGAEWQRSDGHRAGVDHDIVQARLGGDHAGRLGALGAHVGVGVRDFGAADFYGPYPSHERTSSVDAAVRHAAAMGGAWRLASTISTRRHGDRFTLWRDEPARYRNVHTTWQSGAELVARRAIGGGPLAGGALAVGAEGFDLRLRSARLGDRGETRAAAFAELASDPARRAGGQLGVRWDRSSEFGAVVSPTVAARVALAAAWQLRASAGGGWRAPTWTERFYEDPANVGDPALRPERFWTGEVGVRGTPASRLALDAALFTRRARRLIDWAKPADAPATEPWRTRNVEDATFVGAELRADLARTFGVDWTLRASVLDVDAAAAAGFVGRYALRPETRALSLVAHAPLGRALALTVNGGWAGHAGEGAPFRGDARLALDWRGAQLTLDVVNLTDARYPDATGRPVAGRAAYAGVRW